LWGAYHGLFLVLERLFLLKVYEKIGNLMSILITFFVTLCGWVVFKIENVNSIKLYFAKMFSFDFSGLGEKVDSEFWFVFSVAIFFSFFVLLPKGNAVQQNFYSPIKNHKNKLMIFFLSLLLFAFS